MLGMTMEQAARSFGWGNLRDFAANLPQTSATFRALHPEFDRFASDAGRSAILADIFDAINALGYMFAKAHGAKGAKPPEPYPRPGAQDKGERIGSDPIPISEFNDWYYGGE